MCPESVGPPLPGVEIRLGDGGELLARGRNVMLGYWKNPEATRATLTADGWLHTGDLAEIKDGKIFIRGRAKDILVLSNGEKLPPQDAEFAILHDPVFEQVMLVGEGRPYVVLLAVTKETDEKTLIRRANEQLKAFPRWTRVRRVVMQQEPWSVDNGLLTPTLKLKRPVLLRQACAADRGGVRGTIRRVLTAPSISISGDAAPRVLAQPRNQRTLSFRRDPQRAAPVATHEPALFEAMSADQRAEFARRHETCVRSSRGTACNAPVTGGHSKVCELSTRYRSRSTC